MIINMSKMHYFFSTILAPHIHFLFFFLNLFVAFLSITEKEAS